MILKPLKIRSKKIRQSARGERCTLRIPGVCNGDPETVVLCHAPSRSKGLATKSDDTWAAYGCSSCHMHADIYGLDPVDWMRAIHETQSRLYAKELITVA